MSSTEQGFAAGTEASQLSGSDQGMGGGYHGMSQASNTEGGMGGGAGAHGSGVAGGYSSNADQSQGTGEKKDWLDKGIEWAGKKAGVNVVRHTTAFAGSGPTMADVRMTVERCER